MYVLFACGGTAGHIYPALSMARLLREFDKNTRIEFVGTPGGMENRLVPQEGYPIYPLHVSGIARKLSFSNLKAVWQSVVAYMKCRNRMKADRPDLVIGTGGYVCFPVLRAAASLGIPNAVHESNAIPGLAVKAVASKTDRIWLGQKEAITYLSCKNKCLYTGTPLRNGFLLENKYDIRRKMGLPHNAFFVLSFGGSLGAEKLTEAVYDLWKETSDPRLHFLHIRGRSPQNPPVPECPRAFRLRCGGYDLRRRIVRKTAGRIFVGLSRFAGSPPSDGGDQPLPLQKRYRCIASSGDVTSFRCSSAPCRHEYCPEINFYIFDLC